MKMGEPSGGYTYTQTSVLFFHAKVRTFTPKILARPDPGIRPFTSPFAIFRFLPTLLLVFPCNF